MLQLLFDVRFLRNALAGGGPPVMPGTGTQNGPDAAAIQDRRKSFAALEAALQVCQTSRGEGVLHHRLYKVHTPQLHTYPFAGGLTKPSNQVCPRAWHITLCGRRTALPSGLCILASRSPT